MPEQKYPPEFESQVRKSLNVPEPETKKLDSLRAQFIARGKAALKAGLQPDSAPNPFRPEKEPNMIEIKTPERKTFMTTLRARPALVILIALLLLLALSGVAYAIGRSLGYVPGFGLVETSSGIRMLAAPVSVTRDGVTITVTNLFVFEDHVELTYEVQGGDPADVDPANPVYAEDNRKNPTAFCGGVQVGEMDSEAGDSMLRLPNGALLKRDHSGKYAKNVYAMTPVYNGTLPPDVLDVTMLLDCIPWAKLGAVPENWEIPLKLKFVPAGTPIGEPVLEVTPSEISSASDNGIRVSLEKVVPQEDKYSFFFSIVPEKKAESLQSLYPASAYLIDSTGQKIYLGYTGSLITMSPMDLWELHTMPGEKLAYGPYNMVIDSVWAYYDTHNSSFEFDPGDDAQIGQTWALNKTISFGGVDVIVVSAEMVERDLSAWGGPWGVTQGYKFTFHSADNQTPVQVEISDNGFEQDKDRLAAPASDAWEPAVDFSTSLYYLNGIPKDKIQVTVYQGMIKVPGKWAMQWSAPDQTGLDLLDASQAVSSQPGNSGVTAELKRVVKLEDGYLFYLHMTMPKQGRDFQVIEPIEVSVIDSTGRKIKLNRDAPQADFATDDNLWQFSTKEKPGDGPLQIAVEKAQVRYRLFSQPPLPPDIEFQRVLDEYSFIFDVGAEPKIGDRWAVNEEFEIGGYKGRVTSVQVVEVDPQQLPIWFAADTSLVSGYEFTVQSLDPSIQWNVDLGLFEAAAEKEGTDCIAFMRGKAASTTTFTIACRELPSHRVKATIHSITVLLNDVWMIDWSE